MFAIEQSNKKDIQSRKFLRSSRDCHNFLHIGFFLLVKMITNWIYANATQLEIYKLEIIT